MGMGMDVDVNGSVGVTCTIIIATNMLCFGEGRGGEGGEVLSK